MTKTIPLHLLPDDKALVMRHAMLALNTSDSKERSKNVSDIIKGIRLKKRADDIERTADVLEFWESGKPVRVGESGTLRRYFGYRDLVELDQGKRKAAREFITEGTLVDRQISLIPEMIHWSQEKLLELDNHTSQFASAAVLLGDTRRLKDVPFRLLQTYQVVDDWIQNDKHLQTKGWKPTKDATIKAQAEAFLRLFCEGKLDFTPHHSEDVPIAIAFGVLSLDEAQKAYPSVIGHESNRIKAMKETLDLYKKGVAIPSKDHRVVQAIAMKGCLEGVKVTVKHPEVVAKSWPEFWDYLKFVQSYKTSS